MSIFKRTKEDFDILCICGLENERFLISDATKERLTLKVKKPWGLCAYFNDLDGELFSALDDLLPPYLRWKKFQEIHFDIEELVFTKNTYPYQLVEPYDLRGRRICCNNEIMVYNSMKNGELRGRHIVFCSNEFLTLQNTNIKANRIEMHDQQWEFKYHILNETTKIECDDLYIQCGKSDFNNFELTFKGDFLCDDARKMLGLSGVDLSKVSNVYLCMGFVDERILPIKSC